ncbi:mitochondrial protein from FMP27-domain-containing protein [Xylogone sp. PMI_703]|nr:mitochondrial protein from FMP27-domain-containing protein [Xylogone sp. PMI_703]
MEGVAMALVNPTFIFGLFVLLYLSSFILFAVLRIITGISIQRIGYLSLRRLAYTPKDGIKVEIRGLGLNLHRPTFAQPTWLSIVLTELAVTVDLAAADTEKSGDSENPLDRKTENVVDSSPLESKASSKGGRSGIDRDEKWKRLTRLKEQIKLLHRKIKWIRMVDIVAVNSSLTVVDVGNLQIGSFTMAVDTRRRMVDRSRMFSHIKTAKQGERPAEWMVTIRSVLFTPDNSEALEVLDNATLNIHGLLYEGLDGLRDTAIALKIGRLHIPYDDIHLCLSRFREIRKMPSRPTREPEVIPIATIEEEPISPLTEDGDLPQTISDSKEFTSSIIRGIKEIQFAVSFVGFTKKISLVQPRGSPIYLNASMKEVGVDLHRLDQKSPAHRMYFSSKDVAHQALLAALSIAVGVDQGQGKSDRLLYIPMATTTIRTTLPSKTLEFSEDSSADDRNANMLFANMVITSPSVDLDPKHLPLVLALMRKQPTRRNAPEPQRYVLMSRLLPKAMVKFSMHEPVLRIALPPVEKTAEEDDFDLIISSISSISLDIESSHSAVGKLHYALGSTLRLQSHDLYYQTSSGCRYDLIQTESLDLKVQLSANPEVYVVATGNLQTFSIHMVRPEISDGVRQIVAQLRLNVEPEKRGRSKTLRNQNFIRALPPWLLHFQFQCSDFNAEVAGVDEDISGETRGVALQLESWTAEYRAQKLEEIGRRPSRRRTGSRSLTPDHELFKNMPQGSRKKTPHHPTDGRRLAIHIRGLEAFIVESSEKWENEPFISMPRFEVALSTSSDYQGPIFHVNSHIRMLLIQYSLFRHYACGVATTVLRRAFMRTQADYEEVQKANPKADDLDSSGLLSPVSPTFPDDPFSPIGGKELVALDIKSTLVQIKASMPSDPPLMIQIYGMDAGRHRWSPPFFHAKLARLYAEAPKMKKVWARIVSIKYLRADIHEDKRKLANGRVEEERIIDLNTEAIRIAVPHQLVVHSIFDNVINTVKSVQQLHHRFKTGTNEYILDKGPEEPKRVPKVALRSRAFLFEIEDGAFEWKLGSIYRTGLVEQQQRLAREVAFNVKAKKIEEEEEQRYGTSRHRNRSALPRGRNGRPETSWQRSKSEDGRVHLERRSRSQERELKMRYDPEGTCGMNGAAKISIAEARERLDRYNAQSWKKRIDQTYADSKSTMKGIRGVFWGPDQLPDDMEETENILEVPQRPGLMATLISDLHIVLDRPSFPMSQLPEFLHRIGKGMPYDMKYSLLIPMNIQIDMGEVRVNLRDYPLPLLHVPAIKPGQSARSPAWSLKTDFVIGEEFQGKESTRHVRVEVIPAHKMGEGSHGEGGFAIDVRRTISPVKSYSDIKLDINTGFPTRITWGTSYQPAIQDMMMVFETFTKPQADPSERTGFWDKIRLSFHSQSTIAWKGDGDVHFVLKGTRDPYVVTGNGAGFLMCWRNDVRWNVCRESDPRKFMTVESGEFILAVPDFSLQARHSEHQNHDDDSTVSSGSYKRGAIFKKVVMKLSGNVQWMVGLMFERDIEGGGRSFDFEPHYKVILKEPRYAKEVNGQAYDAFRGFRSEHIHMSIAVKAPVDREWTVTNTTPSKSYNTVHFTPRFFTHFFAWWSMFDGTMSLPIRQGSLWPGIEKTSKKFGRHLATIKYSLLLAPLFLSHIYKHKDPEDFSEDALSATGIKMKLDSFMLDIHQRREEFPTQDKGRKTQGKTSGMKMNQAQLDLLSADIRAVSARIAGPTADDLRKASAPALMTQDKAAADLSNFEIPDNDYSWVDMDDFVELDWVLPADVNPETKIMPLGYAPRFTYFRQTDRGGTISGDPDRTSPFGNEPTHFCIMSLDDDPRRVQCQLIQSRLDELNKQMESHTRAVGEAELRYVREEDNAELRADFERLSRHEGVLRDKKLFLESMLHRMAIRVHTGKKHTGSNGDININNDTTSPEDYATEAEGMETNPPADADFISDFDNRFVIHNMQLKWNNLLRNIILRYIHQVSQRRGFVYYLSRRAVKFILDIVEEQNRAKAPKKTPQSQPNDPCEPDNLTDECREEVEARIEEILADGKSFVSADDPLGHEPEPRESTENLDSNIAKEFTPQNSYHLRLIAPQIQLQSDKNPKSVVLVTAKGMELKVVEIMDKDRMYDDVSGLVQRRFSVEMDSTQFFVTQQKWFSSQLVSLYSGSYYGTPAGAAWPPWVPMEIMYDFQVDPFGFKRVVQKTSASLRYDKFNTLRLKYNNDVKGDGNHNATLNNIESRTDSLWVEFPKVQALCNSSQYYAMYIIVTDLLMYSEPMEKTRSERLEKIMLASDFSDLRGAPEMVISLQERIRQLEEIKTQFQIHSSSLDRKGWEDRLSLDRDLSSCEDELFFIMKAITTSQRKYDGSQSNSLLRWNISSHQIVWHLLRDNNQPLMEFQLQDAEYERTDNADGSHINLMQISKIVGLNLLPDAIYPEMFAPYTDPERGAFEAGNHTMLRVYWYMLEAIAGIPVMDHFEVNLFPMKIQLEREVGKRLFEYMFPETDEDTGNGKTVSPYLVKNMHPIDDEEDEDSTDASNRSQFHAVIESEPDLIPGGRRASLELRLKPTLTSETRPGTSWSHKSRFGQGGDTNPFKLFQTGHKPASKAPSIRSMSKKPSAESLPSSFGGRSNIGRSPTLMSLDAASMNGDAKPKRFGIHRGKSHEKEPSDDLTKMLTRASNYMTLAYVKIPSVVLCLSYKGKGERNIEDVHDFVFRLPMIEYRNKTWSNLDLALALKKDVIRALISHTGAIIGNKFKHRPNTAQQSRLRELATSSMLLAPLNNDSSYENSENSSIFTTSPTETKFAERSRSPRRRSIASSNGLTRTISQSSSTNSVHSQARSQNVPASLMMTPMSQGLDRPHSSAGSEMGSSNYSDPQSVHETKSISGSTSGGGGFMSHTFHLLKKKDRDNSHTNTEDNEEASKRRGMNVLGRKH